MDRMNFVLARLWALLLHSADPTLVSHHKSVAKPMSYTRKQRACSALLGALGVASAFSANAGERTFDFTQDPATIGIEVKGNNDQPWQETGGNPGGFLALTYSENGRFAAMEFPDIDSGKIVTAFKFEADLRVGNSVGDRAADGFSVSFARTTDPVITGDLGNQGLFAGGIAEGGTTTGIAICFDTWSGNTLPDGTDIEGIIVRVDNKTVNKTALPTRHGACDDPTSLQTGPRDAAYWTNGGDPRDPAAWATLCWQKAAVEVTPDAKVTVSWKGRKILDAFQTSYFPSAGKLILAGRTGDANEATHFDNIKLVTTAVEADTTAPTAAGAITVAEAGARHVKISWGAATDNSGRVAYAVQRDGVQQGGVITELEFVDFNVVPGKTYKYEVISQDISGNKGPAVSANVTTVAEVNGPGFLLAEVYRTDSGGAAFGGAAQGGIDTVISDPKYPGSPDSVYYVNGLQFGEPNFGDTYGENHMVRIATVLTAPETGSYRFFVRSDDASRLYINTSGAALPDIFSLSPVAAENGCCGAFEEPGAGDNGDGTFPTSEPISLTAGRQYGIIFLVKEGGGGDWGQVGWRKEGASGAAQVITGPILAGKGDPVGAAITFTQEPASATVFANQSVTLTAAATVVSPYSKAPYYQWYKDGAIIPGATSASYTIPVVSAAHAGKYALEVGTIGLAKKSAEATLTVNTDTKAPVAIKADGYGRFVWVTFDEPVKANTGTWTISGGTVSGQSQSSANVVLLTTSDLGSEKDITVTGTGVQDNASNGSAANGVSFRSWKFEAGKVKYENYDNIGGGSVNDLRAAAIFPNSPTGTALRDAFEAPVDRAENFGGRLSAWITPATTGQYVFYISSDDNSELWLSTDDNPANVKRIAAEAGWSGQRVWLNTGDGSDNGGGLASQKRSDTYDASQWTPANQITLTAGNKYYVELLYKEGGGGDNAAMTWKLASAADPANGSPALTGAAIHGTYTKPAAPANPTLGIARDGANVKVTYTGTLQGADSVTGPYSDVAGATSPYTVPATGAQRFLRAKN